MSYQSILPQECYFYEGSWNEETVNVFIQLLLDDKKTGDWSMNGDNFRSLQEAQDFVNVMMEKEYTWDDVLALRSMLKKRYQTFKVMLDMDGVWWDRRVNHVYAPAWEEIFKVLLFSHY